MSYTEENGIIKLTLDQEIPVVVIIQNKKVTDKLEGVVSKTEVLEFLKSNKIVK